MNGPCKDCPPTDTSSLGFVRLSTEDKAILGQRKEMCMACQHYQYRPIFKRAKMEFCGHCGCLLFTRLLTTCPIGRWP